MKEDANLIDLAEDSETEINEAMSGEKKLEEEDEEQPTDWENPEDIRNERQTDRYREWHCRKW